MMDPESTFQELARQYKVETEALLDGLRLSLMQYDQALEDVIFEASQEGAKMTELKLSAAVRNKMRERGQEIPEIARWRLRLRVGGVESHGE